MFACFRTIGLGRLLLLKIALGYFCPIKVLLQMTDQTITWPLEFGFFAWNSITWLWYSTFLLPTKPFTSCIIKKTSNLSFPKWLKLTTCAKLKLCTRIIIGALLRPIIAWTRLNWLQLIMQFDNNFQLSALIGLDVQSNYPFVGKKGFDKIFRDPSRNIKPYPAKFYHSEKLCFIPLTYKTALNITWTKVTECKKGRKPFTE